MLATIVNLLKIHPDLKAKDIAKKLNRDKTDINSLLYKHVEHFKKNEEHEWRCINDELKIEFLTGWISCREFESALQKVGCLFQTNSENIIFVIPKGGQLLLEAIARLMALCNQLSETQ